jgi:hypothetical protein
MAVTETVLSFNIGRELEKRMSRSVSLLATNKASKAYRECIEAFKPARAMSRTLVSLRERLDEVGALGGLANALRHNRDEERVIYRDAAM